MHADHCDVGDGIERGDQLAQPPRCQHQRIATGQDHFPDLAMAADIGQRRLELGRCQRLAARPHLLATEAEAAIDRADMQGLQQHAVGIAMHDALDRRARVIADRVAELLGRDLGFPRARHELLGDRVVRDLSPIDQSGHLGCDGDGHGFGSRLEPRVGRHQPLAVQGLERAQRLHGAVKYRETRLLATRVAETSLISPDVGLWSRAQVASFEFDQVVAI